ncbi:hypothetical protein A2V82_00275 [candidate division KSB1 bacterium RBG_16_48_16]|nr:MAG: hypothetical protein A2V82_00275 [candidate division KSB1 bacterium RBG_16_48_16]
MNKRQSKNTLRLRPIFLFLTLFIMPQISGCYTAPSKGHTESIREFVLASNMRERDNVIPEYKLGFGDVIEVNFFNNEKFDEMVTVRPDGRITVKRLGDMYVAGMTPSRLDTLLSERYARYIREPEITVIVRNFGGYKFYVLGEVKQPGGFELERDMTVMEALAMAGGTNQHANLKSVLILRPVEPNKVRAYRVDVTKLVKGGDRSLNKDIYFLQAKDVVYIPKTFVANISLFLKNVFDGVLPPVDIYLRALWWSKYD